MKFNNLGAWKELNKIDPNRKKNKLLPTDFKDKTGNLITNYESIKTHCLDNIIKRLRIRPMHPELVKIKLSKIRLLKARTRKTPPWTMKQKEKGIKSMKNKKVQRCSGTCERDIETRSSWEEL